LFGAAGRRFHCSEAGELFMKFVALRCVFVASIAASKKGEKMFDL